MTDVIDLTNFREMTDGDVELEKELFEEFFSSSEECITAMESNCVDGENEIWRSNAHAFKGTALNLGADKLGQMCKDAQEGQDMSAAEKTTLLEKIKAEYSAVKVFLEGLH